MKHRCRTFILCAALAGCVTPMADFSDPYAALLPRGYQIRDSTAVIERARLPQQKLALIVGPNFEAGVMKFQEIRKFTANMNALTGAMGQGFSSRLGQLSAMNPTPVPFDTLLQGQFDRTAPGRSSDAVLESGSTPEKTAAQVSALMSQLFGQVQFFPDFPSALETRPDFIAVFDDGAIRHSMTDWSRVGMLHLFTPDLERVVAADFRHRPKPPELGMLDSKAVTDRKLIEWNASNDRIFMRGLFGEFMAKLAQRSR